MGRWLGKERKTEREREKSLSNSNLPPPLLSLFFLLELRSTVEPVPVGENGTISELPWGWPLSYNGFFPPSFGASRNLRWVGKNFACFQRPFPNLVGSNLVGSARTACFPFLPLSFLQFVLLLRSPSKLPPQAINCRKGGKEEGERRRGKAKKKSLRPGRMWESRVAKTCKGYLPNFLAKMPNLFFFLCVCIYCLFKTLMPSSK